MKTSRSDTLDFPEIDTQADFEKIAESVRILLKENASTFQVRLTRSIVQPNADEQSENLRQFGGNPFRVQAVS